MKLTRTAIAVAVLVSAIAGAGFTQQHQADAAGGFTIQRFYNGNGQYCTGLFSPSGQLLSFWGCSGAMGSMRKAAL